MMRLFFLAHGAYRNSPDYLSMYSSHGMNSGTT
jgi:hypothetical protein